jgi:integrase
VVNASTIAGTMLPMRAIYRRAVSRGDVTIKPTTGLEIPAARGGRDRIAPPDECAKLLAALPQGDRALWATAMFAGLRRGELMALRVEDVDLGAGVIHVRRGWDVVAGEIATKSGRDRRVPIAAILRDYLDEHLLGLGWKDGLVFGATGTSPFTLTPTDRRAKVAWKAENARRIEQAEDPEQMELLTPITLHECRHTFASLMIAAGVNAKALSTYMGTRPSASRWTAMAPDARQRGRGGRSARRLHGAGRHGCEAGADRGLSGTPTYNPPSCLTTS